VSLLIIAVVVLAAVAAVVVLVPKGRRDDLVKPSDGPKSGESIWTGPIDPERAGRMPPEQPKGATGSPRPPGFREAAQDSGITFRMAFLPNEQGEKFKVNLYDHGCGVVVGDYDADGHDDIYLLNQLGPNGLYKNAGNGTFTDATATAGVGLGDRICVGATFADYDNDGDQDLYVTSTRGGNVLFQNQGNGTFQDATDKAGLALVAHSQTAAFFDCDNDGYLDLLVTNSAQWIFDYDDDSRYFRGGENLWELAASPKEYNVLYRNNRDGTFTDMTAQAGMEGPGWGGDVAAFDYDEDGYVDLFVTNMFGRSRLYRNLGSGKFADVTQETLGRTSWGAIGSKAFDYNNDGRLDLLVADMHSDMWVPYGGPETIEEMLKRTDHKKYPGVTGGSSEIGREAVTETEERFQDQLQIRYEEVLFGNTMFRNAGNGRFDEVSDKTNLETFWPWGVATGDFNNDGHEDVFLPSGMGYPWFYWRSPLMINGGNGTFTDRCRTEGIEPPARGIYLEQPIGGKRAARSSRCAATGDFDGDGRLELVVNNFNDQPYYFKNNFPRRNYVAFRLRGSASNRDAVGAVVRVRVGNAVMTRLVQAAGGYLSQSSKTVYFGLGDNSRIDRVEVVWPRGTKQVIEEPQINTRHDLTEPGD
jgi:hypothetical protein